MTPRIRHRQKCTYAPVRGPEDVRVGDMVFCKVKHSYFTHMVTAVRGDQYQISNNHGHTNGWITIESIFGRVIKSDD